MEAADDTDTPLAKSSSSRKKLGSVSDSPKTCHLCGSSFGLVKRKHHCRSCGNPHCAECLDTFSIPNPGVTVPKICKTCYPTYDKMQGAPTRAPLSTLPRLCVVGYSLSPHYKRARNVGALLAEQYPDQYEFWTNSSSRDEYFVWLVGWKETLPSGSTFLSHKTSPICWFEKPDGSVQVLGGRDRLVEWIAANHSGSKADKKGSGFLNVFESPRHLVPQRGSVTAGQTRICVAGYGVSPNYKRARNVAWLLSQEFPQFSFWTFGPTRDEFFDFLRNWKEQVLADKSSIWNSHKTAPVCWFEKDDGSVEVIGGRDRLVEWTAANHADSRADKRGQKALNPFEKYLDEKEDK